MKNKIQKVITTSIAGIALLGFAVVAGAQTYAGPTGAPPAGNVPAPINVGTTAQSKEGAFAIGKNSAPTAGAKLDVIGVTSTQGFANFGTSELGGRVHIAPYLCPLTQPNCASSSSSNSSSNSSVEASSPFALAKPTTLVSTILGLFRANTALADINVGSTGYCDPGTGCTVGGSTGGGTPSYSGGSYTNIPNNTTPSSPVSMSNFLLQVDGNQRITNGGFAVIGGRVGVGTTAPDSLLGVHNSGGRAGVTVSTGSASWMQIYQPYNTNQLRIGQGSFANNSVTDIVTIPSSGGMKVRGENTTYSTTIMADNGSGKQANIGYASDGDVKWQEGKNDNNNYYLWDSAGARQVIDVEEGANGRMVLQPVNGNVGIGTWNPTQKLDVAGAIRAGSDGYTGTNGIVYLGDGANYVRSVYGGGLRLSAYNNTNGVILREDGITQINRMRLGDGVSWIGSGTGTKWDVLTGTGCNASCASENGNLQWRNFQAFPVYERTCGVVQCLSLNQGSGGVKGYLIPVP